MNKKIKNIIAILAVILISVFVIYKLMLKNAERNIETEKALFTVTSKSINEEFSNDTAVSTTKYQDKTIEITGIVTDVVDKQLILDGIIICETNENANPESKNKKITVKGRFVGYDDLMGELKMDQCNVKK